MAGDGQVTFDKFVMKHSARKVRRIANGSRFVRLRRFGGRRYHVAREVRGQTEPSIKATYFAAPSSWPKTGVKIVRCAGSKRCSSSGMPSTLWCISGNGDVIEPDEGIAAIGSGGPYAQAAATALLHHSALDAETIAREALGIASKIDIYTNDDIIVEVAS